jgi:hypothetical protein
LSICLPSSALFEAAAIELGAHTEDGLKAFQAPGVWQCREWSRKAAPPREALLLAASSSNDCLSNFVIIAATQTALTDGTAGGAFTTRSCFFDHDA